MKISEFYNQEDSVNKASLEFCKLHRYYVFKKRAGSKTRVVTKEAVKSKKVSKKEKFFLFLQYSKLHSYLVKEVMEKIDLKSTDDEYFNNINDNKARLDSHLDEMDDVIKSLFINLEKLDLSKKTIVIFTADHGTSAGEKKGEHFYGTYVYDYTLKVFLIMCIPGQNPSIINSQCSHLDILPTIAD